MSRAMTILLIGFVFGGCFGFVIAASNGVTFDGHDHATDHAPAETGVPAEAESHEHSELVEAEGEAPGLTLDLTPDPVSGWNLHMVAENFTFTPAASGGAHVAGEGHAHIYANGVKIARAYGNWFHIPSLPEGEVTLSVTLNSNDHRVIGVAGVPVEQTVVITNPP